MSYKKILILATFILFCFFQINVQASINYVRICKYKNLQTNEDVFLHWSQYSAKIQVGNGELQKINYISGNFNSANHNDASYGSLESKEKAFLGGCPAYMNYNTTNKSYKFEDKPDSSNTAFKFEKVVVENRDIYNETLNKNKRGSGVITCDYTVSNGEKVTVSINSKGEITNNKEAKILNVYSFLNIVDNEFRCPTSICYNKNLFRNDELTFSNDVNYSCPASTGSYTNDAADREIQMATNFFGAPTEAQLLNAKIIEEKIQTTISEYSSCLMELDISNKCNYQLNEMNSKCQGELTSEDCLGVQTVYNACVEDKYPSEAESVCGKERLAIDEAALEAEKLKEETGIDSAANLGLDKTLRVKYTYENPDCSTILGSAFIEWLEGAYKILQVGAIVFTVVTGILGYTGAIMSSDDDAFKKATKKFKTRLIITVILILTPVIIEFILGIVTIPGLTNTNPLCK
ncbi:MAG: hypothetical protein PHX03_00745 [Bacilli bacterium]|nr:hypothetical protein [Bacilli bacterium]